MSDEDSKTAVKVGEWTGEMAWHGGARGAGSNGLTVQMGDSGASASGSEVDRFRVRIDSTTVPTINATRRLADRSRRGFAPRSETLCV